MSLAMAIISLGQRLTAGALAGAVLSFAGVLVVVSSGSLGAAAAWVNLGDAMMLIATLAYAIYSTLLKKWQLRLPPLVLLYLQVLVAVVVLFPLFAASPKTGFTAQNIPLVLYACLLASMLAPLAWMQAVQRLGPSRTTLFFNLLPLITALIAAVVLKEQLAMYHLVGGVLTLGGVILSGALDHRSRPQTQRRLMVKLTQPWETRGPAAFSRAACSTNNRTGSAPLPTSPSDWLTISK
jgi:drug/metabolite transporter (DMT)-like permease